MPATTGTNQDETCAAPRHNPSSPPSSFSVSPTVPPSSSLNAPGIPMPLRAFGTECGDLDFDFAAPERFALASAIIAACTEGAASERGALAQVVLELPVGARIAR